MPFLLFGCLREKCVWKVVFVTKKLLVGDGNGR